MSTRKKEMKAEEESYTYVDRTLVFLEDTVPKKLWGRVARGVEAALTAMREVAKDDNNCYYWIQVVLCDVFEHVPMDRWLAVADVLRRTLEREEQEPEEH